MFFYFNRIKFKFFGMINKIFFNLFIIYIYFFFKNDLRYFVIWIFVIEIIIWKRNIKIGIWNYIVIVGGKYMNIKFY